MNQDLSLSNRQHREVEYHKDFAQRKARDYDTLTWDVIYEKKRRWWIQNWAMYTKILQLKLAGKRVLVVGCGFGDDAFMISKMGAEVYAFDLSEDVLSIAREVAERESLRIHFSRMAAENLDYDSDFFDCVVVRDILHHCEIPLVLDEIVRVSKNDAQAVINEVYTHSFADKIRRSWLVERHLYSRLSKIIYRNHIPYITEDERKLNEHDVKEIRTIFKGRPFCRYFDLCVNRLIHNKLQFVNKLDYLALNGAWPLSQFLAGRILLVGNISNVDGERQS